MTPLIEVTAPGLRGHADLPGLWRRRQLERRIDRSGDAHHVRSDPLIGRTQPAFAKGDAARTNNAYVQLRQPCREGPAGPAHVQAAVERADCRRHGQGRAALARSDRPGLALNRQPSGAAGTGTRLLKDGTVGHQAGAPSYGRYHFHGRVRQHQRRHGRADDARLRQGQWQGCGRRNCPAS